MKTRGKPVEFPVGEKTRSGRQLTIRPTQPADHESLIELYEGFAPAARVQGVPPKGEDEIRQWLSEMESFPSLVAHTVDSVHGQAVLGVEDGSSAELGVFVQPEFDREVGSTLIATSLDYARSKNLDRLWATVHAKTELVEQLYEPHGFTIDRVEEPIETHWLSRRL